MSDEKQYDDVLQKPSSKSTDVPQPSSETASLIKDLNSLLSKVNSTNAKAVFDGLSQNWLASEGFKELQYQGDLSSQARLQKMKEDEKRVSIYGNNDPRNG